MTEAHDEMIGMHQVVGLTGIGPARLSLLVRSGLFPARKSIAGWRWSKAEVLEWIHAHPAQDTLRARRRASPCELGSKD